MVKVHILGGPGSGKTTFAHSLSSKFQIPHHDLDTWGWKHGDQTAAYIDDAVAIAEQPRWVTEGIYLVWIDPLLYHADVIVVLDVSWPVAAWRIIWRHITRSMHGTNPYPGINGVKLLFKLLQFTRSYYVDNACADPAIAASVQRYLVEAGTSVEPPDPKQLLIRLETYRSAIPLTADFVRIYLEKYHEKVVFVQNNADRARLLEHLATIDRLQ